MLTIMSKGGPLMWVILVNCILAVGIFLERVLSYHRAHIEAGDFAQGIINALKHGNVKEALALCDDTPGPVARVVKAAVANCDRRRDEVREAVQDVAHGEVLHLEQRVVVLATIAQITPLIGFLGTVVGMIQMFQVIQVTQSPSPGHLAGGVWQALLTTAGGLVVAVPTYVAYNFLVSRVQNLALDMEKAANEVLRCLSRSGPDDGADEPLLLASKRKP